MYTINTHDISGVRNWVNNPDWRVVMANYVCMYVYLMPVLEISQVLQQDTSTWVHSLETGNSWQPLLQKL